MVFGSKMFKNELYQEKNSNYPKTDGLISVEFLKSIYSVLLHTQKVQRKKASENTRDNSLLCIINTLEIITLSIINTVKVCMIRVYGNLLAHKRIYKR
jgi:hypothetical protein